MSVNVIAELNPFRIIRTKLTVDTKSIADIIRELDSGFPPSQARVCRNGEIVKDFSVIARDGDTLWIKFVPYGTTEGAGVGMKIGGWALAIVGFIIGVATSWTGFGAFAGMALVGAGVGMITGGTVLLNMNIPSFKDREKPENDPSIRGGKNQARPHGRIPVLFGRHRLYPDLAANPHTSVIGNQQYFTQLFCGGYRDCVIDLESIKLGETPLAELSQTKSIAQILAGADPLVRLEILQNGEASGLYPFCVHEDAINAPLQHEIDGDDGEKITGEIIRRTPDNTDAINVDIFFYNGLGKYSDAGDIEPVSVEIRVSFKKSTEEDASYRPLGYFNADDDNYGISISGAELKTRRCQITMEGLERGAYDVKIERVTPDSSDSKVIDQAHVGSIRSTKSERPISEERQKDLTIIALRVMATAKVNGVVDSFNYIATSKLPSYSGAGSGELYWLAAAETRNPAAMLLHALRGRASQQRVDPADIDWASIEAFYGWCEDHKYYCDAYLSESVTIAELLRMIGGTSRAEVLRIDSKISVVQDIERPAPVQLSTPKNTRNYTVTMFTADIPDSIALRFIDEKAGYAQTELPVYNTPDGLRVGEPKTVQKVDLWGIANRDQAWHIGRYNYACLKNRPFVHTIEVDIEYLLCNKGDRIQYAGDLALTGAVQGRVVEPLWSDSRCVGFRADEPVEPEADKTYSVRLRLSDGAVLIKDVSITRQPNEIYFTEPLAERDAPRPGDIYAFGIRGREVIDLIITDIQPQADLSAVLTCVEHAPAIFGIDGPDFEMPEFENKITPVSGAVDSGVVGPAKWKLFVTYHDAEREPPRPSGDGQGGGWHYAHTTHALWQSSKTAEAVDSGEWGPPVRIKGERGKTDTVAVYLTLSPQTVILDTDGGGDILAGLLPLTVRAELFKWNYKIPLADGIPRYPGFGADLFDPMLGDFVPVETVVFSLVDAPDGVTVNQNGVITVAEGAALDDEHSITVRAEYEGETYSSILFIQVKKRAGEDRYLGTIEALPIPEGPEVVIVKGPVQGRVRALQGHYVLAIASGTVGARVWKAGYVYQWTGIRWEERDPARYTDLYIRCYKDGLEVPSLTQDMGWFGAVFAGLLVAQKAFIEKLESQVIKLKTDGAIYGGDKYLPDGEPNTEAAKEAKGFWLGADGQAKLEGADVSGHIVAKSGEFTGKVKANEGELDNVTINESCTVKGALAANFISVSGRHEAGDIKKITESGYTRTDDDATQKLNPGIVAYDNVYANNNVVNVPSWGMFTKKLRVAGRGKIRFRVRYQGRCSVWRVLAGGGMDSNQGGAFPDRAGLGYEWSSEVVDLPDDINIFYLTVSNSLDGSTTLNNYEFEARSASEPGLFKLMSSPY